MKRYSELLKEKGILIDVLCLSNGILLLQSKIDWNKKLLTLFLNTGESNNNTKLIKYWWLIKRFLFSKLVFQKVVTNYEKVDFHSYTSLEYGWLMNECKYNGIPYDITLWGSDVLRAKNKTFKRRLSYYQSCVYIKGIPTLFDALRKQYGDRLEDKYRENYFGNNEIEVIDSLSNDDYCSLKAKMFPNIGKKKLIVCGYNNQPEQQHFKMLDAISLLDDNIKSKIHIVLPLTYPGKGIYSSHVIEKAKSIGVSFTALTEYLSYEEVAVIRKAADLTINIQTTDAFAASIQGHLYCNNVVILGKWLNYPSYKRDKVFYLETTEEELSSSICNAINNLERYKEMSLGNREKIRNICSWNMCIGGWLKTYIE
jgi:hypothetical protein